MDFIFLHVEMKFISLGTLFTHWLWRLDNTLNYWVENLVHGE